MDGAGGERGGFGTPAGACRRVAVKPFNLNKMRGLKASQRFVKERAADAAVFYTVHPYLHDLWIPQYVRTAELLGANILEMRIEYRKQAGRHPPDSHPLINRVQDYVGAVFKPAAKRGAYERWKVNHTEKRIARNEYTFAQRSEIIVSFLEEVERARTRGKIKAKNHVRFMLGDLQWFPPSFGSIRRDERIGETVQELAQIINLAVDRCVDHLFAGVYIYETNNKDLPNLLWTTRELARRLNLATGGWLKQRGAVMMGGGGHGADYKGLRKVDSDRFFMRMRRHTGSFAFAYKLMQFHSVGYLDGDMWVKVCKDRRYDLVGQICDEGQTRAAVKQKNPFVQKVMSDQAEWEHYLDDLIGFKELRAMVNGPGTDGRINRGQYPRHANVVFVGDNSDGVATSNYAWKSHQTGKLVLKPSLLALGKLWTAAHRGGKGPNWQGRDLFHLVATRRVSANGVPIRGRSVYEARLRPATGPIVDRNTQELRIWQDFPLLKPEY